MNRGKARRALSGHFRLCPCSRCSTWEQRASERCESCLGARQVVVGAPTIQLRRHLQVKLAGDTRRRTRIEKRSRWTTNSETFNN